VEQNAQRLAPADEVQKCNTLAMSGANPGRSAHSPGLIQSYFSNRSLEFSDLIGTSTQILVRAGNITANYLFL
jgi:hypothetical protein